MEPEGSIQNLQELSTCSYPEPDQSHDTKQFQMAQKGFFVSSFFLRVGRIF
jgi:hypothetical protein